LARERGAGRWWIRYQTGRAHDAYAGTLRHWKYFLGKQGRRSASARAPMVTASTLVEVQPSSVAVSAMATLPFELELGADRKLRIPSQFDVAALERLLAVLAHR
jgi:hypothetical protein